MSSEINIFTDALGAAGSVRKSRTVNKKLILMLLFAVTAIAVLEAVYMFLIEPKLHIRTVQVASSASVPLTDLEITELSGIRGGEAFFSLDTEAAEKRIMECGIVSSVNVEKVFPSTVKINVVGREPFAVTLIESEGFTVPAVMDRDGVVFAASGSAADSGIPVISGMELEEYGMGSRIPEMYIPYLRNLGQIHVEYPMLLEQISEIRFMAKGDSAFDVILYPANKNIRIRAGEAVDDSLLRKVFLVIDFMEKNGLAGETDELDFRTDKIVYKVREG